MTGVLNGPIGTDTIGMLCRDRASWLRRRGGGGGGSDDDVMAAVMAVVGIVGLRERRKTGVK